MTSTPFTPSNIVPFPSLGVTNEIFLKALAGPDWERVTVAWFAGSPGNQPGAWQGFPATTLLKLPREEQARLNTYFCVSLVRGHNRTRSAFERLLVIVLDDVGTKIPNLDQATAIFGTGPSYMIETSPGNYQAGWFTEGLTEYSRALSLATKLRQVLGAGDNLTNLVGYMRLPVGTNHKTSLRPRGYPKGFAVRTDWREEP